MQQAVEVIIQAVCYDASIVTTTFPVSVGTQFGGDSHIEIPCRSAALAVFAPAATMFATAFTSAASATGCTAGARSHLLAEQRDPLAELLLHQVCDSYLQCVSTLTLQMTSCASS